MPDDLGKGDAEKNAKTIFQGVNLVEGKKRYLFLSINISISVSIYLWQTRTKVPGGIQIGTFGSSKEETDGGFCSGSEGGKTEAESQR